MFRISRLTDYGIVVMAHLAGCEDGDSHNARELAEETRLPAPFVSKILKSLTRAGLLVSQRGSKGGYSLARTPGEISVVEMITALEGPVGITECTIHPSARFTRAFARRSRFARSGIRGSASTARCKPRWRESRSLISPIRSIPRAPSCDSWEWTVARQTAPN